MFSLSPFKLLVIAAVVMLVLGPDKLPEVAQKLGATWRTLKSLQQRVESEVREAIPDLPSTTDLARAVRSPLTLLNTLADRVDTSDEASPPSDESHGEDAATAAPLVAPPPPPPPAVRFVERTGPVDPSLN